MNEKIRIRCNVDNLENNNEFVLNIQKAMLVALLENKKINIHQYEYAVKLLENICSDNFLLKTILRNKIKRKEVF